MDFAFIGFNILALIKLYVPLIILLALIPIANQYVRSKKDLFSLLGLCLHGNLVYRLASRCVVYQYWCDVDVGASPTLQAICIQPFDYVYGPWQFIGQNFFNLGVNGTLDYYGHYALPVGLLFVY